MCNVKSCTEHRAQQQQQQQQETANRSKGLAKLEAPRTRGWGCQGERARDIHIRNSDFDCETWGAEAEEKKMEVERNES
jgi:hypothetical protein